MTSIARAFVVCATVLLMLIAAPTLAHAQRVAVTLPGLFGGPGPTTTVVYDLASAQVVWSAPGHMTRGVFTGDGRLLLYWRSIPSAGGGGDLVLADTVTNASLVLPVDFEPWVAHPRMLAMYGLTRKRTTGFGTSVGVLARLDGAGLHELGGCPADSTASLALAPDAGTLATTCESGDVTVVDTGTGATRRVITAGARPNSGVAITSSQAIVVVQAGGGGSDVAALFDSASGAPITTSVFPPGGGVGTEPCRAAVAASVPDGRGVVFTCSITVFSSPRPHTFASTRVLDPTAASWGGLLYGAASPYGASVDPDGRVLMAMWQHSIGSAFARVDLATGAATTTTYLQSPLVTAYAPAMSTLSATTNGRRVDLSWSLPEHSPMANGYALEVGTGPGLSDLGTITMGAATSLSVPIVPPGTYFVRVRGLNHAGIGAASNEAQITVP